MNYHLDCSIGVCGDCEGILRRGCCGAADCEFEVPVRKMYRGDTLVFDVMVLRPRPAFQQGCGPQGPLPLAGYFMWFTMKRTYTEPDIQAVARADSTPSGTPAGGGIVFLPQPGGAEITVPPLATRGFPDGRAKTIYDVQVKDPAGRIFTVERGVIVVAPDVTLAIQ